MKEQLFAFSYQKLSATLIILFLVSSVYSQNNLHILDENNQGLAGVEVFSTDYSFHGVSNLDGYIQIPDTLSIPLHFHFLGYKNLLLSQDQLEKHAYTIEMNPVAHQLDLVEIVGRNEIDKNILPYHVTAISNQEIKLTQSQTSADALARSGDIYIQKSQMGGGSPVIRGFEANKVLLVVDGVRMNNAIYRNGHLQSAITVDQAILEEIEVLYGPNSLIYGSDALGGVVHFRSVNPKLSLEQDSITHLSNFYLGYNTANKGKTAHLDFNKGGEKLGSLTSISYSKYKNLRGGSQYYTKYPDFGKRLIYAERIENRDTILNNDNPAIQIGTAYSQYDFLQKILYQPNDDWRIIGNFQYSNSSNIPRYDMLIEPDESGLKWADWHYGPQKRMLFSLNAKNITGNSFYDKAMYILSYQKINEERIKRKFGNQNRNNQLEAVGVWNFTADYNYEFTDRTQLLYGFNLAHNKVNSTAKETNIVTEAVSDDVLTRYPSDGSSTRNMGIYFQYHWMTEDKSGKLLAGMRYSYNNIALAYSKNDPITWPVEYTNGISSNNQAISWALGWKQDMRSNWTYSLLASTAFRAPNIDDIAKIRVKNNNILLPNLKLKPEKSLNLEANISKSILIENSVIQFSGTTFYTRLHDAIVRTPGLGLNNESQFISGQDTFQIETNQNVQKAEIKGLSLHANWNVNNGFFINTSSNWTLGKTIASGEDLPLAHIPPTYGKISMGIKKAKWSCTVSNVFNGAKLIEDYGGSTDNPELATPEGALSWNTINIYSQLSLTDGFNISLSLENIFDKQYRPFASGLSGAGRSISIRLTGSFN